MICFKINLEFVLTKNKYLLIFIYVSIVKIQDKLIINNNIILHKIYIIKYSVGI